MRLDPIRQADFKAIVRKAVVFPLRLFRPVDGILLGREGTSSGAVFALEIPCAVRLLLPSTRV
jgi:hypothetical protein